MKNSTEPRFLPDRDVNRLIQVKICGLTRVKDALGCASLGADAVGFIFYPKSPRYLADATAREISSALPGHVKTVGVFVNAPYSEIMSKIRRCRLSAVQLHGNESEELVHRLRSENIPVIKALFTGRDPLIENMPVYQASAYLVECGRGPLPGGNAREWNWRLVNGLNSEHPLILAGGLTSDNVSDAILAGSPDAVDVSSGVELRPGIKDLGKVEAFIRTVAGCNAGRPTKPVF